MEVVVSGHNFESILPKTIHAMFALNWLTGFRGEDLNNFPIGSYVKTMSADGGHFEPRSGSLKTILEVDHLGPSMTCILYWLTGFRGEDFKTSYVKTTVCPLKVAILDGGQGHWTQF